MTSSSGEDVLLHTLAVKIAVLTEKVEMLHSAIIGDRIITTVARLDERVSDLEGARVSKSVLWSFGISLLICVIDVLSRHF